MAMKRAAEQPSLLRRLLVFARKVAILGCVVLLCVGLYLLASIVVTTDGQTGQERLNGRADSSPLVVPLLLLLGAGGGLAVLLPERRSEG